MENEKTNKKTAEEGKNVKNKKNDTAVKNQNLISLTQRQMKGPM